MGLSSPSGFAASTRMLTGNASSPVAPAVRIPDVAIAVNVEQVGLQLAQVALAFGADALVGDLGGKRTLPLLDGPVARQKELTGLLERAGRSVRFIEAAAAQMGDRP